MLVKVVQWLRFPQQNLYRFQWFGRLWMWTIKYPSTSKTVGPRAVILRFYLPCLSWLNLVEAWNLIIPPAFWSCKARSGRSKLPEYIQVGNSEDTTRWWYALYTAEKVVPVFGAFQARKSPNTNTKEWFHAFDIPALSYSIDTSGIQKSWRTRFRRFCLRYSIERLRSAIADF